MENLQTINDIQPPGLCTIQIKNHWFLLPSNYINLAYIGEGSYGVVVSAFDNNTNQEVAIKKISPFEHYVHTLRALREVKFLCCFDHDNIISLMDLFSNKNIGQIYKDVYMVCEKMSTDMAQLLKSQRLSSDHVCYFSYQIARGLKYLHSANIVHRDLKPSNLLINASCDLKICDFGLARVSLPRNIHNAIMTEYVATRWYRAPEIMLNSRCYGLAIDIWGFGCILGEMIQGGPLFPGKHYIDQLELILQFVGTPSAEDMNFVHNEKARMFLNKQPIFTKVDYSAVFPTSDFAVLDLLDRCLSFNPLTRYDVNQCICHPFFKEYHDEEDEPTYGKQFEISEDVDEDLPREKLAELIEREIEEFNVKKRQIKVNSS